MPRRMKLLLSVMGAAGVVALGAWSFIQVVQGQVPTQTPGQMRHLIEEHLPLGSTVQQTIAFLHAHHVGTDVSDLHSNRGSTDDFEDADPQGSTLYASIPDAYQSILINSGIFMKFGFNTQGRLARYEVKSISTGL